MTKAKAATLRPGDVVYFLWKLHRLETCKLVSQRGTGTLWYVHTTHVAGEERPGWDGHERVLDIATNRCYTERGPALRKMLKQVEICRARAFHKMESARAAYGASLSHLHRRKNELESMLREN